MLSGKFLNHHGEYIPNKKHQRENKKKYIARNSFCFFWNFLPWTIKKTIIMTIKNISIMLIAIHEKLTRDGLINCCISKTDILLWRKYIVKMSNTKRISIHNIITLLITLTSIFLNSILISTNHKITRQTKKSLTKYQR